MESPAKFPPGYLEQYSGKPMVAATVAILVIATILCLLRAWVRISLTKFKGWDDYLLLPAWLFLVGLGVAALISVRAAGVGKHVPAVVADDPNKLVILFKIVYVINWFNLPSNMLSRVSVVTLYLRIFQHRVEKILCWVVISFLISDCVTILVATQFQCRPLAYLWDRSIKDGHCFNFRLFWKLSTFPSAIADVAILLLPMRTVWTLKCSTARKFGVSIVFLTGSIGLVASCIRTVVFFKIKYKGDFSYHTTPMLLLWTMLESGMYFAAACLIGLRPIQSKFGEWTLNQFHTIKSALGISSNTAEVGSQSSQQGVKKQKIQDPNSLTFILNNDLEMESMETNDLEHCQSHEDIGSPRKNRT